MKPRHLLITLLALLTSITASAEKWTDANGTVWTFTTYGSTANISNMLANYTYSKAISGKIPANLNIPTTLNVGETPYTVTSIRQSAFYGCQRAICSPYSGVV